MADHTLAVAESHAAAPHQTGVREPKKHVLRTASGGDGPIHRAADANRARFAVAVRYAFAMGRRAVGAGRPDAEKIANAVGSALEEVIAPTLLKVLVAGGEAGVGLLLKQLRTAAFNPDQPRDEQGKWTHGAALVGGHKLELTERGDTTHVHVRMKSGSASSMGRVVKKGDEYRAHVEDLQISTHITKNDAVQAVLERSGFKALAGSVLKMRFDAQNPEVIAWAKKHAAELVTQISETTRDRIRLAVEELQEEGDWELAHDRIMAAVGDEDRADLIARNETMLAAGKGQRLGWDQAVEEGLLTGDERRVWIVTPDEKLCPICAELEDETAPLDGEYVGGIEGPPAHIQCRCTEGII